MNSMDAGGAALLTGYSVIIDAECDKSQSWLLELKMKKMALLSVKPAHSGKRLSVQLLQKLHSLRQTTLE